MEMCQGFFSSPYIWYKCFSVKWQPHPFIYLFILLFKHCSALQEAQEIFGGDFDFAEFDPEAYDHAEEEEEDQDDEAWDRPKKQTKRRVGRRSIFEIYEPSELESSHMTDQDNEIRSTDMPERFQVGFAVRLNLHSHPASENWLLQYTTDTTILKFAIKDFCIDAW